MDFLKIKTSLQRMLPRKQEDTLQSGRTFGTITQSVQSPNEIPNLKMDQKTNQTLNQRIYINNHTKNVPHPMLSEKC